MVAVSPGYPRDRACDLRAAKLEGADEVVLAALLFVKAKPPSLEGDASGAALRLARRAEVHLDLGVK